MPSPRVGCFSSSPTKISSATLIFLGVQKIIFVQDLSKLWNEFLHLSQIANLYFGYRRVCRQDEKRGIAFAEHCLRRLGVMKECRADARRVYELNAVSQELRRKLDLDLSYIQADAEGPALTK